MASRKKTAVSAKTPASDLRPLLAVLVKALDDKKAEDLRVLHVGEQSSITDYLVLATGMADTHLRALRREAERVLKEAGVPIAGMESTEGSGWLVFDAYQVMVHLFLRDQRANYQLEQLWGDAEELEVAELLAPPAPTPAPAAAKKTAPVRRKAATRKAAAKKPVAKRKSAKGDK